MNMNIKFAIFTGVAAISLSTLTAWAEKTPDYKTSGVGLNQQDSLAMGGTASGSLNTSSNNAGSDSSAQNVREQSIGVVHSNSNSTPKDNTLGFNSRTNRAGMGDSSSQNVRDRSLTNSSSTWRTNGGGASINTWQHARGQTASEAYSSSNSTSQDSAQALRDRTNNADKDNTALNARDRDEQALTPLKQGNSKEDINTTSQIRREIVRNKDMSTTAHNIKVITVDGKVTLRGPVKSEEEKRTIAEIAQRLSNGQPVDNQLEVKRNQQ